MSTYVPVVHAVGGSTPYDSAGIAAQNTPYDVDLTGLGMSAGQSFWFLAVLPDGKVAIPSQPLTTNAFVPTGTDLEMLIYDPDTLGSQTIIVPTSAGSTHPISNLGPGVVGGSDFEDVDIMVRSDGEQVLVASVGRPFNFWNYAVDGIYPTLCVFRRQSDGTWAFDAGFSKTAAQLAASGTATSHGMFPTATDTHGNTFTDSRDMSEIAVFPQSSHLICGHYSNAPTSFHSGGFSVMDDDLTRMLEVQIQEITHTRDGGLISARPRDLTTDPTSTYGHELVCVTYDAFNAIGTSGAPALGNERLTSGQVGGSILGWGATSASVAQDTTHGVGGGNSVQVTAAFTATAEVQLLPGVGRDIDSGNLISPSSLGAVLSTADAAHWNAGGTGTLAFVASKGLRWTAGSANIGGATLDATPLADTVPCTPGHLAQLVVTVEAVTTVRNAQCGLRFYNAAGTRIASAFQTQGKDAASPGTTYTVTALVPSGAVTMAGAVTFGTTTTDVPASGEQHYIRNMTVNEIPSGFRVEPAVPYQVVVSSQAAATARFIRPEITFIDRAGNFLRQDRMAATTKDTTGSQTAITFTSATAPAGAFWGYIGVFIGGTTDVPAAGEIHYLSGFSYKVAPGGNKRLFNAQVFAYDARVPSLTAISAPFTMDDRFQMQTAGFAPNGDLWVSSTLAGGQLQGPTGIFKKNGDHPSICDFAPPDSNWTAGTATSQWGSYEVVPDVKLTGLTGDYLPNIVFDDLTDQAWLTGAGHSPGQGAIPVTRTVDSSGSTNYKTGTTIDVHSYDLFPPGQPYLAGKAALDVGNRRLFIPLRGITNASGNPSVTPFAVPSWLIQIDLQQAPSDHVRTNLDTLSLLGLINVSQRFESVRFDVLDEQLNYLRTVHPVRAVGAAVDWNTTGSIKRTLTGLQLSPDDADAIDVYSERIQPWWLLENGAEFPLGVFMFSDSNRHRYTYGRDLQGTLGDQTVKIDQPRPYSFTGQPGASIRDAALQIIAEAGIVSFVVDPSSAVFDTATPFTNPAGTSRWAILQAIAALGGWFDPYFDNNGTLRLKVVPNPSDQQDPEFLFNDDNSTMLRNTIVESEDLVTAPNQFIVVSSGATTTEIVGVYDLPDNARGSALNRGGLVIAKVIQVQGIATQIDAEARARTYAAQDWVAGEWVEFDAVPDPRHDGYNFCQYRSLPYRETAWNLALQPGGPMHHSLRLVYADGG